MTPTCEHVSSSSSVRNYRAYHSGQTLPSSLVALEVLTCSHRPSQSLVLIGDCHRRTTSSATPKSCPHRRFAVVELLPSSQTCRRRPSAVVDPLPSSTFCRRRRLAVVDPLPSSQDLPSSTLCRRRPSAVVADLSSSTGCYHPTTSSADCRHRTTSSNPVVIGQHRRQRTEQH